jgi:four helix bundle protein
MKTFDHERLDVYQTAIRFVVVANDVVEQLPRGRGYLADELQRAATSVVLNVAEGAGEFTPKEKARFYRMARRSATESSAILDVCRTLGLLTDEKHSVGRDLLLQVVSMLVRMITNLGGEEGKGTGRGTGRGKEVTAK